MKKMSSIRSFFVVFACLASSLSMAKAQDKPIALVARTILDGTGKIIHNQAIIVEGSKISRIGGPIPADALVYNLGALTVTPGLIDTHSHILYHFENGRYAGIGGRDGNPVQAVLYGMDNAVMTLDAGFTTIQSPGAPADKPLRDAIARGIIPGPRIPDFPAAAHGE